MAKEKDPAFLFYSKDWLQGTAGLMPDEKGVYIDLLSHQHQNGSLPTDVKRLARMVGLSQVEFDAIWINLKGKFTSDDDNHMVNQRLTKEVTKRSTKAHTKAITGKFAALIKSANQYPAAIREMVKAKFNVADFEPFETNEAYSRLTIWFTTMVSNAIGNANTNTELLETRDEKGGMGEREGNWNKMPGPESAELGIPEIKAGSAMQLMHLAGNKATIEQVYQLWGIFKTQHFTGKKFYETQDDVFSHFINWSKTQKINGTQSGNGRGGAKLGTSEGRTQKAREWGSEFIPKSS